MLNSKAPHKANPADKIASLRKNPMIQEPRRLGSSGSSLSRWSVNLLIAAHFNGMRGNPHPLRVLDHWFCKVLPEGVWVGCLSMG
jgi:hypothetical protein